MTRWTKLDTDWEGVPIQEIMSRAQVRSTAKFVVAHSEQGYTANLPIGILDDDSPPTVCVERAAWTMSGQAVATVLNASASWVQPFFSAIEKSRNASSLTSSASIAPSGRSCALARNAPATGRPSRSRRREQVVEHLPGADAVVGGRRSPPACPPE